MSSFNALQNMPEYVDHKLYSKTQFSENEQKGIENIKIKREHLLYKCFYKNKSVQFFLSDFYYYWGDGSASMRTLVYYIYFYDNLLSTEQNTKIFTVGVVCEDQAMKKALKKPVSTDIEDNENFFDEPRSTQESETIKDEYVWRMLKFSIRSTYRSRILRICSDPAIPLPRLRLRRAEEASRQEGSQGADVRAHAQHDRLFHAARSAAQAPGPVHGHPRPPL